MSARVHLCKGFTRLRHAQSPTCLVGVSLEHQQWYTPKKALSQLSARGQKTSAQHQGKKDDVVWKATKSSDTDRVYAFAVVAIAVPRDEFLQIEAPYPYPLGARSMA